MSIFTNNEFINQRIDLDDNIFDGNKFQDCTLVYGGGPLTFNNNNISGSTWEFVGSAARTIDMLKLLQQMDGTPEDFIQSIFSIEGTEPVKKEGENGQI